MRAESRPPPTPPIFRKRLTGSSWVSTLPRGSWSTNRSRSSSSGAGRARILEPAPGAASLNVLKMARDGLALELSSAFPEARKENAAAERLGVPIRGDRPVRGVEPGGHPREPGRHGRMLFPGPVRGGQAVEQ